MAVHFRHAWRTWSAFIPYISMISTVILWNKISQHAYMNHAKHTFMAFHHYFLDQAYVEILKILHDMLVL
jgi:hypothetical protein